MRMGPRHLLILASLGLATLIGTAALQRGAWGLTLASVSATIGLTAVLVFSSRGQRPSDRRAGLSHRSSATVTPVETQQEDLPDPLNHGFDIPL